MPRAGRNSVNAPDRAVRPRRAPLALAVLAGLAGRLWAAEPVLRLEPVAVFSRPTNIASARDGSGRLFVNLQSGQIVIFDGARVLSAPFLDIASLVSCCGERGLLGTAFHPRYQENGLFYIYYTDRAGNIVVARYRVSSDPNAADPQSATVLLRIPHPSFANHNGGELQFGPDGYLYIGVGDGGGAGDPGNNAQSTGTLLGKMLRIDVDRGFPYAIPADNPFAASGSARPEIWAYGLRNPWRFSFDGPIGDLYIGDVGQNTIEEIDFQPAGAPGGDNYGWRLMEGSRCYNPSSGCNTAGLKMPILEYDHSLGCSVTGGHVYRGRRFPSLAGLYIYGDYCSGRIWGGWRDGGGWKSLQLLDSPYAISTFGEDEAGELYLAHYATGGAIYRIVDAAGPPSDVRVLPVAGSTSGAFGAVFRTSLQLHNPTGSPAAGRLVAHPQGVLGTGLDPSLDYRLDPGSTLAIPDLLPALGLSGLASVDLVATTGPAPVAVVRVFNDGGAAGTSGFTVEMMSLSQALAAGNRGVVLVPADLLNFRMNVGVRALGSGAKIAIVVRNASGATVQTLSKSYPPDFFAQVSLAEFLGGAALAGSESLTFQVSSGAAIVYGATVDNRTQDGSFLPAQRVP